jgi:uncharacterized protein (DUF885 family)
MTRRMLFGLFVATQVLPANCSHAAESSFERECTKLAAAKGNDATRLHEFFKLDWEHTMQESPEFATEVGYPGQNDRWTDQSLEAIARRKGEQRSRLKVVESIERAKLNQADQLNYDLLRKGVQDDIEGQKFKGEYMPMTQMNGVQQDVAEALDRAPRATMKDFEDMLARLKKVPALIDQIIVLLTKGAESGITPPRITLRDVAQQIENQTLDDPDKSALLKSFSDFPPEIPAAQREKIKNEAVAIVKEQVVPAYRKLHEFFVSGYLPRTRETIAMSDLPDGKAWYGYNVRTSTTASRTPAEIHQLGLSEVKRIRAEMDKLIEQTDFKGNFEDFSKFLRSDPQFYYTDAESLLRGYRDIAKRADPELAKLFGKLPRVPYGVRVVPAYAEQSQTTAYYLPGSAQAGRAGWFMANTYALNTRPKWEMEALTLHEAVPGHHLQISLAQELQDVPDFRKHVSYTAFVEGWGLYSESLGSEMGFYKDPYMKYGQLTYEMWRAIRLVLDTGMHSMGWTRQQAIDYFKANSSKTEHDIIVEVDRYIVWPGQALAYKIGELKIKELRQFATKELGEKFDVRRFHDVVLGNGAVPLDVLEARVKEWVAERKNGGKHGVAAIES